MSAPRRPNLAGFAAISSFIAFAALAAPQTPYQKQDPRVGVANTTLIKISVPSDNTDPFKAEIKKATETPEDALDFFPQVGSLLQSTASSLFADWSSDVPVATKKCPAIPDLILHTGIWQASRMPGGSTTDYALTSSVWVGYHAKADGKGKCKLVETRRSDNSPQMRAIRKTLLVGVDY